MKQSKVFLAIGLISALITSLLYWIDTDPPYAEWYRTAIEFSIITAVLFTLISGIYLMVQGINRIIKT